MFLLGRKGLAEANVKWAGNLEQGRSEIWRALPPSAVASTRLLWRRTREIAWDGNRAGQQAPATVCNSIIRAMRRQRTML